LCRLHGRCRLVIRFFAVSFVTGLNEVKFGLVAPTWFCHTLIETVGKRQVLPAGVAELAVQDGI